MATPLLWLYALLILFIGIKCRGMVLCDGEVLTKTRDSLSWGTQYLEFWFRLAYLWKIRPSGVCGVFFT